MPGFLLSIYKNLEINYPKFYKMDNLCKLGFLAAEIILKNRQITEEYKSEDIGIILANSNSSLETDIKYYDTVKTIASPAVFVYTLPNIVIGEIAIRNNIKGENAFFLSKEFDAGMMVPYVKNLFEIMALKACLFGWVECLDNEYKAYMCLVENKDEVNSLKFDVENINKTYLS